MPLCAGSVSCTKSRSSYLLHLLHMDQMLEQARREAKGWTIAGIISAAAGLSVWAFNPPSWPAWFAGGAFVIVGFYLVRTSRPFLAAVEQLLRTEQPCDMHLTIRGTAQQIDEHYYAELRFPPNAGAASWDIRLYVGYQPWFEVIQNPLPAKVWGATRAVGPIVIETVHGSLLPAGPGALSRRPTLH